MSLGPNPAPQERCARLRWKGMFLDVERDPAIPNTSDGFFWCSLTMNCLGPDGRLAHERACRGGRGCYEDP
jgi:hypothetical protein